MRKMKDSGIEWIGEIPERWEVVPNKRVMTKEKSICEHYNNEPVLSLTMRGVIVRDLDNPSGKMPITFDGYQYIHKSNLLMCLFDIDVTPRCVGVINNDGVTSPAYSQFILNSNANVRYYFYYYLNLDFTKELLHLAKNLRHSLTESQLGEIYVPLPPLSEQRRIADYLDAKCGTIDSAIEKQTQIIEKLQEYKRSLITQVVTKGLNPKAKMKDSGIAWIGEIPEQWEVRRFKNYGTCRNGLTYSPDNLCDEGDGVLVLRSSNIQNGCLAFDDNVYVNSTINEELFVKAGDILICSRNGSAKLIGKNAIIPDGINASFGAFMMIYRCKNPTYFRYILNSSVFSSNLASFLTATVNQLTTSNFLNMKFCYTPSTEEQNQIVDFLDSKCNRIDAVIAKKQALIEKLTEYKKSLIYEVVTGKREI